MQRRHKIFTWLTCDEINGVFRCAHCGRASYLSPKALASGDAVEFAAEFVKQHKGCEL